jgi:phospholipase/carboxylesterase
MSDASIVVQRPAAVGELVLLFHGVGSSAANMVPIGEAIAKARPGAAVVSVDAPKASTLGRGREWFSVVGVTEDNRPARIAEVMPLFLETVARRQHEFGVRPGNTAVLGFSQGSIMALEATQAGLPASRVVALAGRFAEPVRRAPIGLAFHLIHGEQDGVVPASWAVDAQRQLQAQGAKVSLDLLPDLGHGIDARALKLAIGYL